MNDVDKCMLFGAMVGALFGILVGVIAGMAKQETSDKEFCQCAERCGGWDKAKLEKDACFCLVEVPNE